MFNHPINQANENSPFGKLTREDFYKTNQITHQETFMLNKHNLKIFTQTWTPNSTKLKGIVCMVHGYTSDSGWLSELTSVAIAKAGFLVCALDLQGHGRSQGLAGHIPRINQVVSDCIQYFDSIKTNHPKLPSFLYGESLGGAISILICIQQKYEWNGLVLSGSMCGISAKYKPMWPLEKLLPVAAALAPTWKIVVTKPVTSKAYKEEWKRKLVGKNPNRRSYGKPPAATAMEFLRVCEYVQRHCGELVVPLLMLHGEEDAICDVKSAKFVFECAGSKDKSLMVFPGMWHMLVGECSEDVESVFGCVLDWIKDRADKS